MNTDGNLGDDLGHQNVAVWKGESPAISGKSRLKVKYCR